MRLATYLIEKCYKEIYEIKEIDFVTLSIQISLIDIQVEFSTFFKIKGLLRLRRVYSLHLS